MRKRQALSLALTTALAFGCASANAQEGQDKPVPAPPEKQPGDPVAAEKKERALAAEERIRAAEARAADAKMRLGQLEKDAKGKDDPAVNEARVALKQALMELERVRADAGANDPKAAEMKEHARAAHERV